ncbi:hypothetical protein V4F39_11695 [Aquincola sp. MAHUQ-54]|uniref:YXWGXW repeat-containing protein n=1 Tax=Aquincola agrisoli TaxID=3119538 RepID=A0AAW9QDV7_9BURK
MNVLPLSRRRGAGAVAAAAAALLLAGCAVYPAGPYYGDVVAVAPPPVRIEAVGVAPFPGAIWINGYWGWRGGGHYWVPGRWDRPRPGYHWSPHRWDRRGPGWRERPGRWDRD